MIGGKPITVQMPAGNQRTLVLNQVPGAIAGKIVCLPNSTVATNITEQPKLMVVSRPKQPSATIGTIPKHFKFYYNTNFCDYSSVCVI